MFRNAKRIKSTSFIFSICIANYNTQNCMEKVCRRNNTAFFEEKSGNEFPLRNHKCTRIKEPTQFGNGKRGNRVRKKSQEFLRCKNRNIEKYKGIALVRVFFSTDQPNHS